MKKLTLLLIIICVFTAHQTMASKSRGGLSKKEYSRLQASKVKKTSTSKSKSSSSSKPKYVLDTSGGLPVYKMVGDSSGEKERIQQQKDYKADVAKHPDAYKKSDKKKSDNKKKKDQIEDAYKRLEQRTKASNYTQTSGLGDLIRKGLGVNTANASDGRPTSNPVKPTSYQKQTGLGRAIQIAVDPFALRKKVWGDDRPQMDLGVTEALGLNNFLRKDTPTNLAYESNPIEMNPANPNFDFLEASKNKRVLGDYDTTVEDTTPISPQLPVEQEKQSYDYAPSGGYSGVSQAPQEDSYTSSLNDYVKGFGKQEKMVEKGFDQQANSLKEQIKTLIAALDPEYAAYQAQAQKELNTSKTDDVNQLASLFAAYGTADSEQRMQQQERVQSDYASKLADLLSKLQLQKQKDITGYNTKQIEGLGDIASSKTNALSQIMDAKNSAKLNVAQLLNSARQAGVKSGGSKSAGSSKISRNDIFNWTNEMINNGYSWQEIADSAQAQGIGTETGGYLDQLLNRNFRG